MQQARPGSASPEGGGAPGDPRASGQSLAGEAGEGPAKAGEGQPRAEGTELRLNPWWDAALQEKHEYLRLRHRVWSLARARTSCCCGMSPVAG